MAKCFRKRKCLNCADIFHPDHRSARRQKYCGKADCRAASKAASQKRWRSKPENQKYFRGPENTRRVQEWRKRNPKYWRHSAKKSQNALQDHCEGNNEEKHYDTPDFPRTALQDFLVPQHPLIIGLIAHFTGMALQDDIANTARRLQRLGADILSSNIQNHQGEGHVKKNSHLSRQGPPDSRPIQLGGRPPGP